jgi:predicted transcriptional regulator
MALTNEIRKQITENYEKGKGVKEITNFLSLPESTVRSVIKIYASTGRIDCIKRGGNTRQYIPDFLKERVVELVNENAIYL